MEEANRDPMLDFCKWFGEEWHSQLRHGESKGPSSQEVLRAAKQYDGWPRARTISEGTFTRDLDLFLAKWSGGKKKFKKDGIPSRG